MPDCKNCTKLRVEPVPYSVHEISLAVLERTIKRLWLVILVLIILLVGTNIVWIGYESQWEEVTITQEAQADGDSDIVLRNVNGDYYGWQGEADG